VETNGGEEMSDCIEVYEKMTASLLIYYSRHVWRLQLLLFPQEELNYMRMIIHLYAHGTVAAAEQNNAAYKRQQTVLSLLLMR